MSKKRSICVYILSAAGLILVPQLVRADFIPIAVPTAAYTSSTILLPDGVQDVAASSVTNGSFSVGVSGAVIYPRAPVPVGWQTWSSPPFSETATPPVIEFQTPLSCSTCVVSLAFSAPVSTFGFEAEPDPFPGANSLVFTFYDGSNVAGAITEDFPTGVSSARLFAASTAEEFTGVTISSPTDFALANLRYTPAIVTPEPAGIALCGLGIASVGMLALPRRRRSTARLKD